MAPKPAFGKPHYVMLKPSHCSWKCSRCIKGSQRQENWLFSWPIISNLNGHQQDERFNQLFRENAQSVKSQTLCRECFVIPKTFGVMKSAVWKALWQETNSYPGPSLFGGGAGTCTWGRRQKDLSKLPVFGEIFKILYAAWVSRKQCGGDPTKARTAKYLAGRGWLCAKKNILKLVLLVPFLGYFFGHAKK